MRERILRLVAERDEYRDALLRLKAEFDNYRKRTAREASDIRERAAEGLVEKLLVVDSELAESKELADSLAPIQLIPTERWIYGTRDYARIHVGDYLKVIERIE